MTKAHYLYMPKKAQYMPKGLTQTYKCSKE